jgi:hypothetical protein
MKIGIIDADLLGRKNHRFPNIACEKISGFWKEHNAEVILLQQYSMCLYTQK